MENVVPGALQRLRAADIIRMAGLSAASLGQEYCRQGMVHSTQRHGARLSGSVDLPPASNTRTDDGEGIPALPRTETGQRHYQVEVVLQSPTSWTSTCPCSPNASVLCPHGAALLYQWLARPAAFIVVPTATLAAIAAADNHDHPMPQPTPSPSIQTKTPTKPLRPLPATNETNNGILQHLQTAPTPVSNLLSILTQSGLSELRSLAREYDLPTNGMSKAQLAEAILGALSQPETVRRIAAALEKPQRQLLAAITLAGGAITDDDLRGLFERFSLGQPGQLQNILVALQAKALLFRTSLNSSQPRSVVTGPLLDIGWYVPMEVRNALRVSVPLTTFDIEQEDDKGLPPTIQLATPFRLLADLLLIARVLDGSPLDAFTQQQEPVSSARTRDTAPAPRTTGPVSATSGTGSMPIPPPTNLPSPLLLATLQKQLPRPLSFLRFAIQLLRLADILHEDDSGAPTLRTLPHAADLLLGPTHQTILHDLFELWLLRSSYTELFALQEMHLRLRCRATLLNMPVLRSDELDRENSEARQSVLALLAQAPLNQWMSFSAFARFVYRLNPLFLQRRQRLFSSPHWWLEYEEGHPLRPLQLNDWLRGDIHYLAHLLSGPLHWWGLCDIALSSDGRLLAFRLTPLAAWLLNGTPLTQEVQAQDYHEPSDSLEVVDTEEVLVTCSSEAWSTIALLETFAQPDGVAHERLRYCLTPKALGEALSQGHRPADLLALLRALAARETLPDHPLRHMVTKLEQWIASYGRVRIYTGVTLLETTDAIVMRELSATTSLDELRVQAIHPTLLILKKTATAHLLDDLKRRGQSPLSHDEDLYGSE